MSDPTIRTERLLLRRWRDEDLAPYAAMCSDPAVMRYIGSGTTRTREQARASIRAFERGWSENRYGLFAVERLEDARFIGFAGLSQPTFLPEIMPAVEVGWRLARQNWGRGYATEAARAALDFGFRSLGLHEIVSIVQVSNRASVRIAKKLGMALDRETQDPTSVRPVRIYRAIKPNAG